MAILNYTTSVDADKTIGEINTILLKAKAREISFETNGNGKVKAVKFCIDFLENPMWFRLAPNFEGVRSAMFRDNVPNKLRTDAQAIRVGWRIIKDALAAQMAIVQSNQGEVAEVFLPYAYNHATDETYFAAFKANQQKQLTSGEVPKGD